MVVTALHLGAAGCGHDLHLQADRVPVSICYSGYELNASAGTERCHWYILSLSPPPPLGPPGKTSQAWLDCDHYEEDEVAPATK